MTYAFHYRIHAEREYFGTIIQDCGIDTLFCELQIRDRDVWRVAASASMARHRGMRADGFENRFNRFIRDCENG